MRYYVMDFPLEPKCDIGFMLPVSKLPNVGELYFCPGQCHGFIVAVYHLPALNAAVALVGTLSYEEPLSQYWLDAGGMDAVMKQISAW